MPTGVYIRTEWHKEIIRKRNQSYPLYGESNGRWKGGIKYNKIYRAKLQKEWRHEKGISKRYKEELGNISKTKEYKRYHINLWKQTPKGKITLKRHRQRRRALFKNGGELTVKTIQMVYEDNIKKYGTLTCYLCLNPIEFGKDNLEHRIPLSRDGTNEYNNLAIACVKCNCKKHKKTEEEFRRGSELLAGAAG